MIWEFNIFWIFFHSPFWLFGIFLIPIILYYQHKKQHSIIFPKSIRDDMQHIFRKKNISTTLKTPWTIVILMLFILTLSTPYTKNHTQIITKNGIDIVLLLDISHSMNAIENKEYANNWTILNEPTRLQNMQNIVSEFIESQQTNRLSLVGFAGVPIVSVPLTFDYILVKESLNNLSNQSLVDNKIDTFGNTVNTLSGTNIGEALLAARNQFTLDDGREKVIILVSDGTPTPDSLDPILVSQLLKKDNIIVHSIGIWSVQWGSTYTQIWELLQVHEQFPALDESFLKSIAKNTSGSFFRSRDSGSLEQIFNSLLTLEKHDIEISTLQEKKQYPLLLFSLLLCWLWIYYFFSLSIIRI